MTDPDLVRERRMGEILSGCDHHLIRFNIRRQHELIENVSRIPDYGKANFSHTRELLPQSTWEGLNFALVDDAWNNFKNMYTPGSREGNCPHEEQEDKQLRKFTMDH